jgi:hypothetical protein
VRFELAAIVDVIKSSESTIPDPPTPEPAKFSAVFFITEDDFWLDCWKGPTPVANTLADVKPTLTGVVPAHDVFRKDFAKAVANLQQLFEAKKTTSIQRGVLVKDGTGYKIKLRHVLFEVWAVRMSLVCTSRTHVLLQKIDSDENDDGDTSSTISTSNMDDSKGEYWTIFVRLS